MARPRGQFEQNKEACFRLIVFLTRPTCWASNVWLAEQLGCSVRQVTRYIAALVKENRIILHMKRYVKEGMKTRRFIRLVAAVVGKFGKPVYSTPPSQNRYEAPETVTAELSPPEIVTKPQFGKPDFSLMTLVTQIIDGREVEMEKSGSEPKADPMSERLKRIQSLLAMEAAKKERIKAEEADPAVAFRHMEYRLRAVDRVRAIKLDVSHKVPKED